MFHKRRSMLGRRHLLSQQQQQPQRMPTESQSAAQAGSVDGISIARRANTSWRGQRSGKKTSSNLNKASREFKKCLFSKSPGLNYLRGYSVQGQDRSDNLSGENMLDETGITSIGSTPSSLSRNVPITPMTSQRRRAEMVMSRYGPLSSGSKVSNQTVYKSNKPILDSCKMPKSSKPGFDDLKPPDSPGPSRLDRILLEEEMSQQSTSYVFDSLKPPNSPGPSRLDRILLEEKMSCKGTSYEFDSLKPPTSPGPSRLDRILAEEKLSQKCISSTFENFKAPDYQESSHLNTILLTKNMKQPVDPDLRKLQNLCPEDPNTVSTFSPPLSSTCIGTPDSGKKPVTVEKEIKETLPFSGKKKLSVIKEDCDMSVIEFELNEQTITELDETMKESTIKNGVVQNNDSHCSTTFEEQISNHTDEFAQSWISALACLDNMEQEVMNRAKINENRMENLKKQIENLKMQVETDQKNMDLECQEYIKNIKSMRNILETLKLKSVAASSIENKENRYTFKIPTCRKKQLDEESKWLKSVKAENPGLLKTPNPSRKKMNQTTILTPHSLSMVLHDQMNDLYD